MDDRSRMLFEEFLARGYMFFVFALTFSGGFLHGLEGEGLFYAQGVIGACLVGSFGLLILKMHLEDGEISLKSYSRFGANSLKIIMWCSAGGLTSAFLVKFFTIGAWGCALVGSWVLLAVMVFVWWKKS